MEFQNGTWSDTTFSIINNTVTTSINTPGIFALFAPVHPVGTSTEVIPESTSISTTMVTTTQPTPKRPPENSGYGDAAGHATVTWVLPDVVEEISGKSGGAGQQTITAG